MNEPVDKTKYKVMIHISVNGEGKIKIDTAIPAKDFVINLLADAMKVSAMIPDNVKRPPPGLSPEAVKNWLNRQKKKQKNKKL